MLRLITNHSYTQMAKPDPLQNNPLTDPYAHSGQYQPAYVDLVHHRAPGRGAHLHPRYECLDLAERRRAFPRALRVAGPLDLTALHVLIESEAG